LRSSFSKPSVLLLQRSYAKAKNLWAKQLNKYEIIESYDWEHVREKDLRKEAEALIKHRTALGFKTPPMEFYFPDHKSLTDEQFRDQFRSLLRQDAKTWEIIPDILPKMRPGWPKKKFIAEHETQPVLRGNYLTCKELKEMPALYYDISETEKNTYFTILVTNPDMPMADHPLWGEFMHYVKTNIPGKDLDSVEALVEWMQPIPLRGTGLQRMVYHLLAQNRGLIDYKPITSHGRGRIGSSEVDGRGGFSTQRFMEEFDCSSRGICWVSTKWDETVSETWKEIGLDEPAVVDETEKNAKPETITKIPDMTKEYDNYKSRTPDKYKFE